MSLSTPTIGTKNEGLDEFFFQKGSSWTEKGVKFTNARIQKINKIYFEDFQKGSSWREKGINIFNLSITFPIAFLSSYDYLPLAPHSILSVTGWILQRDECTHSVP